MNNRKRKGFAGMLVFLLCTAMMVMSALAGTSKVLTSNMNFRRTPSGVRISTISAGTVVEYNYTSGEWDNVTYNNIAGWIHTGNLADVGSSTNNSSSANTTNNYIYTPSYSAIDTMGVVVQSGYLALRNAKAYDSSNEIGKLYTGDVVDVYDNGDSTYWYVYSSKLGSYGYVNKNYLSDVFSRTLGMTFTQYKNSVRVRHAKEMILQGGLSMTEIAHRTGFDSSSRFSKVFHQIEGMSPQQYQAKNR